MPFMLRHRRRRRRRLSLRLSPLRCCRRRRRLRRRRRRSPLLLLSPCRRRRRRRRRFRPSVLRLLKTGRFVKNVASCMCPLPSPARFAKLISPLRRRRVLWRPLKRTKKKSWFHLKTGAT